MSIIEQILFGLALAMDCFSVSLATGLSIRKIVPFTMLSMAFFFGLFQALMPLFGWFGTIYLGSYIEKIDHWIAFVLLCFIGTKMVIDHFKEEESSITTSKLSISIILILSVATSIDALAVGVSFTCMGITTLTDLLPPIIIIGLTSFLMSVIGNAIGVLVGRKFHFPAELIGGLILIAIGIKVLIEHLGGVQ